VSDADANSRENSRITLGLLEAVERGDASTQRRLAADLGIALGLVNIYLKRCIKKGLVKVSEAPARRYAYYLTPQGFAEKTRLTAEYLSWSLTFFRHARSSCTKVFEEASRRGWKRVALAGAGDLADIARICATDRMIEVALIIDATLGPESAGQIPVKREIGAHAGEIDGIVITGVDDAQAYYEAAVEAVGAGRVLAPDVVPLAKTQRSEVLQ
jgi:DNA-binding MarR family transcriptional regulator